MPRLSIIMIVKNEAQCLARCLESVQEIADELVVVDTGSTDSTSEIIESFGARTQSIVWENDFAAARNVSIAVAQGDWLLHMDADEVLDAQGAQRIREIVDGDGEGADAIELVLANYSNDPRAWRWVPIAPDDPYGQGFAGYIRVGLLRLFRNGRGYAYREAVHENITESVVEGGGVIRAEEIIIHHYGFDHEASRHGEKARLYLEIAEQKMRQAPENLKALHDYAEQALACNMLVEAEAACRRALKLNPVHLESASTLANLLLNRGDLDQARQLLLSLETAGIHPPHVGTALAAIALRQGRNMEARERLSCVREQHPEFLMAQLYWLRLLEAEGEEAEVWQAVDALSARAPAIEEYQSIRRACLLRREAAEFFSAGDKKKALSLLVEALRCDSESVLGHNDLGVVLYGLGAEEKACESFERALGLAPGMRSAQENLKAVRGEVGERVLPPMNTNEH